MSHNTLRTDSNKVAVDPLHGLIIKMFGSIAFACVLSGGMACLLNFGAKTIFKLFGIELSTTSVGIAFVAIGVFTAYFAVKIVLNNRRDLEQLRRRNRSRLMRVARSKARKSTAASRNTPRRHRAQAKVVDSVSTTPDNPRI